MVKINFTLMLLLGFFQININLFAVNYTWDAGAGNSNWSAAANWSPNAVPSFTDNITIVSAAFQPLMNGNTTVGDLTINSGSLDLSTYTITINGIALFNGGTINNGLVKAAGIKTTFAGTIFDAEVTAVSTSLFLNGSIFNNTVDLTKNGTIDIVSDGGNTFNSTAKISNSGTSYLMLANMSPDIFNADVVFTNTGNSSLLIANDCAGNKFNGNVTLNNTGAGSSILSHFGEFSTVEYNGNIIVNNTSPAGIFFGALGGTGALANGKTITLSGAGFDKGTFVISYFTQMGTATQALSLTGTAKLQVGPETTFNANVAFTAPELLFNGAAYNGTAVLAKTGATDDMSLGNNFFNSTTTIINSGAGFLRMATEASDDFNGNITFVKNGLGDIHPVYDSSSTFAGNITVNSSTPILFGAGAGVAEFDGANAQTINKIGTANPIFNRMWINKTGNDVTLNTEVHISTTLTLTQQYIISSAANLLILEDTAICNGASNNSFVSGPVRKIGKAAFIFPVGKNGFYHPAAIAAPSLTTDHFTAEYFDNGVSSAYSVTSKDLSINSLSGCEYWTLDRTSGSSNVMVSLGWNTNSCGVSSLQGMKVAHWDGSMWKDQGNSGVTGNISEGVVTSATAAISFDVFTLGSSGSLNSVNENIKSSLICSIFPNPYNGVNTVINVQGEKEVQLVIKDINGKDVFSDNMFLSESSTSALNALSSGIYFVIVTSGENTCSNKLIVQ